jgi:hypothetical protein
VLVNEVSDRIRLSYQPSFHILGDVQPAPETDYSFSWLDAVQADFIRSQHLVTTTPTVLAQSAVRAHAYRLGTAELWSLPIRTLDDEFNRMSAGLLDPGNDVPIIVHGLETPLLGAPKL